MESSERRKLILTHIKQSEKPVSASALATLAHVSRQIIVGDVALLRAAGHHIIATPRGYVCDVKEASGIRKTIAVDHTAEQMMDEIYTIIDLGGTLVDVIVEHPIYGQLSGQLHIASRYDEQQFYKNVCENRAKPLSNLTNGLHLHTLQCPSEEVYTRIIQRLDEKGFLYKR